MYLTFTGVSRRVVIPVRSTGHPEAALVPKRCSYAMNAMANNVLNTP